MKELQPHIFSFVLPLFCANIAHMIIVRLRVMEFLAIPVSENLFGAGKTWRGFIVLPLLSGIALFFFNDKPFAAAFCFGAILGATYMIGELPNSFLKRRLGIRSGKSSERFKVLQLLFDKLDSLLLLGVVYYFMVEIKIPILLLLIGISFVIHIVFSFLLYVAGIKKSF